MDFQYRASDDSMRLVYNSKKVAYPFSETTCPIIYEKDGGISLFLSLEITTKIKKRRWPFFISCNAETRSEMWTLPLDHEKK